MQVVIKGVDADFEPVTYGTIAVGDEGAITVSPRPGHEARMQRIRRMSLLTRDGTRIQPDDPKWGATLPFGLSGSRLWAETTSPKRTKALAASDLTAGGALVPSPHSKGTVQVLLPPPAAAMLREWVTANLDPADVVEEPENYHITLRYGFLPEVRTEAVTPLLALISPFEVLISEVGVFEGAEGGTRDVLVAWVADIGPSPLGHLHGLHEVLGALPHEESHDSYRPHVTLAMLASGDGEAVLDSLTETPHLLVEVTQLEWRGADGTRAAIPLTGGPMPLVDAQGGALKAWDESQHPREPAGAPDSEGGQFAASGGGADARPQYEVSTVKEAYALLSQHQRVILAKPHMVATLLDKLADEVKKAKAAGRDAPTIDLCDVAVKDTNIFCEDSLGVPRIKMPQLKGVPTPGSPADRLPKDKNGKVVLDEPFRAYLEAQGLRVTSGLVPAAFLKATQNELDGAKAAKFLRKYEQGWVQDRALFVSADDYIVDGHHHWAAKVAQDVRSATDVDRPFRIRRVHAPILEILVHALKFSTDMGIPPAPVFAKKRVASYTWSPADWMKEWNESQHPREPEGAPDSAGGRFTAGHAGVGNAPGPSAASDVDDRSSYYVTTVEEAFDRLSAGQKVILAKPRMVSTLLDKLAEAAVKAHQAGKPLVINLCDVSVAGSNIFCAENVGYSRVQMPQLVGRPRPETPADYLPKNKHGEVDLGPLFTEYLEKTLSIDVTEETILAKHLKASQSELDGEKVAGMMRAMALGKVRPAAIFVTTDDYVVDGHHRWAAKLGMDLRSGLDLDAPLPVSVIHATILEVLVHANSFAIQMGIPPARMKAAPTAAWWARQVQKEWDESQHPREPGGSSEGGQFTESGGGGGLSAELVTAFDQRLADAEGETVETSGERAEDWNSLGDDLQEQVEKAWKSSAFDTELEYQQQSWDENERPEVIQRELSEDLTWAQESWDSFAEDNPLAQMLDKDSLFATATKYDIGEDGFVLTSEGAKGLQWDDPNPNLPGMEPPSSEERWAMLREAWKEDYKQAKADREEEIGNSLEYPDYLSENAQESLDESWSSMDDTQKWAEAKGTLSDEDLDQAGGGGGSLTVRTPKVWEPFAASSTVTNYDQTRSVGLYLAAERTADLIMEHPPEATGHDPAYSRESAVRDAHTIAHDVWEAWKDKSGEGLGLSMQIAAAEHFGLPITRWTPTDIAGAKDQADQDLPGGFAALKSYVRALNETSQYILKKANVDTVNVYRAVMLPGAEVDKAPTQNIPVGSGEHSGVYFTPLGAPTATVPSGTPLPEREVWQRVNVQLSPNGAASSTRMGSVANGWTGVGELPVDPRRIVLRTAAPPSAILSLPVYGQNVHSEEEVVILGNDWKHTDAWVTKAPAFEDRPVTEWREADHPRGPDGQFI